VQRAENPLAFVGKILDSTVFLSLVLFAIACLMGWAAWRR
jgi:hypothetical protein